VTIFDYLILFILIASIVISMIRGLVKEVLSLLGWIVAFVVANAFGVQMAGLLPNILPGYATRLIVAFLILFIAVKLLMLLLTMLIESMVNAGGLSIADRGLGGLFGLARGLVIVLSGVLLCGMTAIPQQAFWKESLLQPVTVSIARTVMPFLPGAVVRHVKL
jgi:membrane protein required for colicin V production